jgi:hypothetical protein
MHVKDTLNARVEKGHFKNNNHKKMSFEESEEYESEYESEGERKEVHREMPVLESHSKINLDSLEKLLRLIYRRALYGGSQNSKMYMEAYTKCFNLCSEDAAESHVYKMIVRVLRTEAVPPNENAKWSEYFDDSNREWRYAISGVLLRCGIHRNLWKQIILCQYDERKAFNAVLKTCSHITTNWTKNMKGCDDITVWDDENFEKWVPDLPDNNVVWGDALFSKIRRR